MSTVRGSEIRPGMPYLPLYELAAGGMGRVTVAVRRNGSFERLYAIKRIHAHLRGRPELQAMFLEEARLSALVRHPNVVSVLDAGEDDDGPFLVMDYVHGLPLNQLIGRAVSRGEQIPIQIALRIGIDVARGLSAIHETRRNDGDPLQLVHRDLSPHNVLIGHNGIVAITDFGIAKVIGSETSTASGVLKGKTSYMAPEQLRFEPFDQRADLFALGIMLYEMLAGARLYPAGQDNQGIRRTLHEPPPDLGDVRPDAPSALVELVFALLAKQREDRPPNAATVAHQLERCLADELVRAPAVELVPYVAMLADELRVEQQERLRVAIASLPVSVPTAPDEADTPTTRPLRAPASSARRGLVALAVLGTLIVGLGAAFWIAKRDATAATPPPTVADGLRTTDEPD